MINYLQVTSRSITDTNCKVNINEYLTGEYVFSSDIGYVHIKYPDKIKSVCIRSPPYTCRIRKGYICLTMYIYTTYTYILIYIGCMCVYNKIYIDIFLRE